ncbi:MAG: hypothetical protein MI747_25565, partial [Desulfobacterales bacterium]|nr:hypothetical protein [Desulfobacterales bacterium]
SSTRPGDRCTTRPTSLPPWNPAPSGGAGLDVTDPEPMAPDNPLLSMERVSVLPHIGSATHDSRDGMSLRAAENIVSFYRTGKMPFIVNPRVLD